MGGTGPLFRRCTLPKVRYSEDTLFGLVLGLGVRVSIAYVRNSGPESSLLPGHLVTCRGVYPLRDMEQVPLPRSLPSHFVLPTFPLFPFLAPFPSLPPSPPCRKAPLALNPARSSGRAQSADLSQWVRAKPNDFGVFQVKISTLRGLISEHFLNVFEYDALKVFKKYSTYFMTLWLSLLLFLYQELS